MSTLDTVFGAVVSVLFLPILLSNRWGDFSGTHNWRVSRRMDRELKRRKGA